MPWIFSATAIFVRERRWPQPGWPVRGPCRHVTDCFTDDNDVTDDATDVTISDVIELP